ncbi:ATP-binding protein [Nostoc sp. CHAB 5834]|nr:ATP-binding protein [Nostoc sp. CHAB 5834]
MLKRVSIQNFKSLKDVTLDLQKVNLLIGPNNSGKTNFLKALEFVKENYREFPRRKDALLVYNRTDKSVHFLLVDDSEDPVHIDKTYNFNSEEYSYKVHNSQTEFAGNGIVPYIPGQRELERLISDVSIYKPDPNKLTQPGQLDISPEIVVADASNLVGFLDLMLGKYRKTVFSRIEADLHTCLAEFDEIKIENVLLTDELKNYSEINHSNE